MFKGSDVFPQSSSELLRFDETNVVASGKTKDVAKGVDLPDAFAGEVDRVRRVIHLSLHNEPRERFQTAQRV
jgi:hypothetical protein